MRTPIYEPKGKAKEYGDLALNIYTGCPHHCYYCYSPSVLHKDKETFHAYVEPRPGIVEEVQKQLEKEQITDKLIHLCFTCDPYPTGNDSSTTREIIKLLKKYGNHIQILTKGDGSRDFDLLGENDWYGITYAGYDAHYVVQDEDGVFSRNFTENTHLGKFQGKRGGTLLTLRGVRLRIYPTDKHVQVVTVRSNRRKAKP